MKKKILLIMSMCLIVLGLTACGQADPTKADYNGYTYDQLMGACQSTVTALESLTKEEMAGYKTGEDEMLANLVTRWEEARSEVGDYIGFGDFTITKSGKTLTCEQKVEFDNRPILYTQVYNAKSMELEDVTVDPIKTMGEKLEKAALNTLLGMGTVFSVLILISLLIYGFKVFPYIEKRIKAQKALDTPELGADSQSLPVAEISKQDDLELVAVIAAAIAASTGTSTEDFVVRSIKRRY